MQNGVVTRWFVEKGFGFLAPHGGGEHVFVHRSGLVGADCLAAGDHVAFETEYDAFRHKTKAVNCRRAPVVNGPPPGASTPAESALALAWQQHATRAAANHFLELSGQLPNASSAEFIETFVANSSAGRPFLVVSENQLVASVRAPDRAEFQNLWQLVVAYVQRLEAAGAVMVADFEGEMLGHGGELTLAALQQSYVFDRVATPYLEAVQPLGLLVDLRNLTCVDIIKRIMESMTITKLMWGANCDCQSLMYQKVPIPLDIKPSRLVDIQLAFSPPERRLSMKNMLEQVPRALLANVPEKEQIDWDYFHSGNCRALAFPLSDRNAAYAMDDVLRIEAIVQSQGAPSEFYVSACIATEDSLAEIRADPYGLNALKVRFHWFEKYDGVKRTVAAVALVRHILSLQARGADLGCEADIVSRIERAASYELSAAGVVVPADLSFTGDELGRAPDQLS
jgi:CspA family cold shock protein